MVIHVPLILSMTILFSRKGEEGMFFVAIPFPSGWTMRHKLLLNFNHRIYGNLIIMWEVTMVKYTTVHTFLV